MLFFNLSRNELNKKSSRPNMIRGRTWHRMNRGGRRGKEGIRGMRGKRGTGDGERSRTRSRVVREFLLRRLRPSDACA